MGQQYVYLYKVSFLDEQHESKQGGLVCADTYISAIAKISDYYGDDNILEVRVEAFGADPVVFSLEDYPNVKRMLDC